MMNHDNNPLPPVTLRLSKVSFNRGVEVLVESFSALFSSSCSQQCPSNNSDHNSTNSTNSANSSLSLHQWRLGRESCSFQNNYYLFHPLVIQRIYYDDTHDTKCESSNNINESNSNLMEDEYGEIDDDTILFDPAVAIVDIKDNTANTMKFDDVEWTLSIVYSDTWSVPVLYFQVQYIDGKLLTREQVLKLLKKQNWNKGDGNGYDSGNIAVGMDLNEDKNDDDWNFISQEEHPVTGVPTFHFHPCQTSTRLHLIYRNCGEIVNTNPAQWILTWMSMILPAAGFRISTKTFASLSNTLKR